MIQILHQLHLSCFHLMAHSLSAVILPYALPSLENSGKFRIKSLICIDQFGAMIGNRIDLRSVNLNGLLFDEPMLPKLYDSVDDLVRKRIHVTENVYPGAQTISQDCARLIIERNTKKKEMKWYLRIDPKLKSGIFHNIFSYDLNRMRTEIIQKAKTEILAVFADNGWPGSGAVANKIDLAKMPNFKVLRMKGSHHLHADDPKAFLNAVTPFLTSVIQKYKQKNDTKRSKL